MWTLFIFGFFALAVILGLMWVFPAFRGKMMGWGSIVAGLLALFGWLAKLFTDAPSVLP